MENIRSAHREDGSERKIWRGNVHRNKNNWVRDYGNVGEIEGIVTPAYGYSLG